MVVPLSACLMIAAFAQEPAPDRGGAAEVQLARASDASGGSSVPAEGGAAREPAGPYAQAASGEAPGDPAAEEPEARVCRRTVFYDDFGRQRSRRVCRPRS